MLSTNDALINFSLKKKQHHLCTFSFVIITIFVISIFVIVNIIVILPLKMYTPGNSPVCCIASNIEDWIDESSQPDQNVGGHMCLQIHLQLEVFQDASMN